MRDFEPAVEIQFVQNILPIILWRLIIWWCDNDKAKGKDKDKKSASNTQCMLYFLKAGGSIISRMAFPPQTSQ